MGMGIWWADCDGAASLGEPVLAIIFLHSVESHLRATYTAKYQELYQYMRKSYFKGRLSF